MANETAEMDDAVARRIASEKDYHEQYYRGHDADAPVLFHLAEAPVRKAYNLTWAYYDAVRAAFNGDLKGKRILVVGCGEGLVALNLAREGALVDGFDLSDEAVAICRRRAARYGLENTHFFASSCEALAVPAGKYDAVVGEMILHHIDIPSAVKQFDRALAPGGVGVFMEWKVYPVVDFVRSIPPLPRLFPPGGVEGYATEYERKLTAADFAVIRATFPDLSLDYRYCLRGKIGYFSTNLAIRSEKLDYQLLRAIPPLKWFTDGVVITFRKQA